MPASGRAARAPQASARPRAAGRTGAKLAVPSHGSVIAGLLHPALSRSSTEGWTTVAVSPRAASSRSSSAAAPPVCRAAAITGCAAVHRIAHPARTAVNARPATRALNCLLSAGDCQPVLCGRFCVCGPGHHGQPVLLPLRRRCGYRSCSPSVNIAVREGDGRHPHRQVRLGCAGVEPLARDAAIATGGTATPAYEASLARQARLVVHAIAAATRSGRRAVR
jgi:hypothetical protein